MKKHCLYLELKHILPFQKKKAIEVNLYLNYYDSDDACPGDGTNIKEKNINAQLMHCESILSHFIG